MAFEILQGQDIKHTALHDLESFFYILLFICVRFGGPCGHTSSKELPEFMASWHDVKEPLSKIAQSKKSIIVCMRGEFEERVMKHVDPYFEPLKDCIRSVAAMFCRYYNTQMLSDLDGPSGGNTTPTPAPTLLTHERFIEILEQAITQLEQLPPSPSSTARDLDGSTLLDSNEEEYESDDSSLDQLDVSRLIITEPYSS